VRRPAVPGPPALRPSGAGTRAPARRASASPADRAVAGRIPLATTASRSSRIHVLPPPSRPLPPRAHDEHGAHAARFVIGERAHQYVAAGPQANLQPAKGALAHDPGG